MRGNGYTVTAVNADDIGAVKTQNNVPPELQSCHTAIVDGYVVEGHVPVAEVERMLAERPAIAGIAVRGMPIGSPGMEMEGSAPEPYAVIAFTAAGATEVYAQYP